MTLLEKIENDRNEWIIIKQDIPIIHYLKLDKGISFYRQLTNSRRKFRNVSNYHFFRQKFVGGFYNLYPSENKFHFLLFLRVKEGIDKTKIETELKIRVKKNCFSDVEILNSIPNNDQILLSHPNGLKYYQKVLGVYKHSGGEVGI